MRRAVPTLLVALAACGGSPPPVIALPHAVLTDAASERVHARCEVRGVRMLDRGDVDRTAASVEASFAEIVYEPDRRNVGVVLFRCPEEAK